MLLNKIMKHFSRNSGSSLLLSFLSRKPKTVAQENRERVDSCYSAVFNSPAGRVVLEDLLRHSVCRLRNSDLTDQELRALAGQTQLVLNILTKIKGE